MKLYGKEIKELNSIKLTFPSNSVNEGFARSAVASFCAQLDPTSSEIGDIKCAVSEAVTNCIVHAYKEEIGLIYITVTLYEFNVIEIKIKDKGCGIPDVANARQPLFTTDKENERSGMGFTVMESFTDKLDVQSKVNAGTTVVMIKRLEGRKLPS